MAVPNLMQVGIRKYRVNRLQIKNLLVSLKISWDNLQVNFLAVMLEKM